MDPVQGAGRRGGRRELHQRADRGDGQLPTVRQPLDGQRSTATSSTSCSATRSTRPPARPTPTNRSSSTARCRASTTWARRSNRSSPGRRCTAACIGPNEQYVDKGSLQARVDRRRCLRHAACAASSRTPATSAPTCRRRTDRSPLPMRWRSVSDAFFYRLGEKFWEMDEHNARRSDAEGQVDAEGRPGAVRVRNRDRHPTAVRVDRPHPRRRRQEGSSSTSTCSPRARQPRLLVGDNVQVAIGQGLMAATPLQMANAYSTLANGGFLLQPTIVKTIYEPLVPDLEPGMADLSKGSRLQSFETPTVQGPAGDAARDPRPDRQRAEARGQRRPRARARRDATRRASTTRPPARSSSRATR